jgi:hypothetical protein
MGRFGADILNECQFYHVSGTNDIKHMRSS